jgi:2-polyprenyl-6-methoxyphenol hydroxylase-like FAD-dependent oxidoreductase
MTKNAQLEADVAVVGASIGGSTLATLLAREGLRVALIERSPDPNAYKRLCGHFIQASATPVIRRLGIDAAIERAGGVRNGADVWTRWGWIRPRPAPGTQARHGYSLRRSKLDPMVRGLAAETPGVTYLGGMTATALSEEGERVTGVVARDRARRETHVRASLVVGADGRNSDVARLAGARERTKGNQRFCYMAYFAGLEHATDRRAGFWMLDPDVVISSPNDEGITLVALFVHKPRLGAFKRDREGAFREVVRGAPGAPDLGRAERVSKFIGYVDYSLVRRQPTPRPGLALLGDAALTADPVWAIGCGWAFESASWLADAVTPALHGEESLRRGLRRYRAQHRRRLAGHARVIADAAKGGAPPAPVRALLAAATRDNETALRFEDFGTRSAPVHRFLSPRALARAAWVNAKR